MSGFNDNSDEQIDRLIQTMSAIDGDIGLPLAMTLCIIARHPGLSIGELADLLHIPQQTASRQVGILLGRYQMTGRIGESVGRTPLIELTISKDDPRRRALYLTSAGDQKIKFLINIYEGNYEEHSCSGKT